MSTRWTAVITSAGLGLLADVQGRVFNFTRAQCGAGYVDVLELKNQTAVSDFKKNLGITSISTEENVTKLRLQLSNTSIATSFNLYQIGVFAKLDNDPEDVLFMIIQADTPDYIPSESESPNFVNDYLVNVIVGNADSVSGTIDVSAYVTVGLHEEKFHGSSGHNHNGQPGNGPLIGTDGIRDDAIGNEQLKTFTVDHGAEPETDTGKPGSIFSWLANRIKAITGKSDWKTAPRTTLENALKRDGDSMTGSLTLNSDKTKFSGYTGLRHVLEGPVNRDLVTQILANDNDDGFVVEVATTLDPIIGPTNFVEELRVRRNRVDIKNNGYINGNQIGTEANTRLIKAALSAVNIDTVLTIGIYHLSTNCTNMPIAGYNGWLTVTPHAVGAGTDYILQEAVMWGAIPYLVRKFQRVRLQGTWRPWEEVPLVVERGVNSNGEYVRYSDGTQVCRAKRIPNFESVDVQSFTYPAAFVSTVEGIQGSHSFESPITAAQYDQYGNSALINTGTVWQLKFDRTISMGSNVRHVFLTAIGRWR